MAVSKNIKLIITADGKQAERAMKNLKGELSSFAAGVVTAGAAIGAAGLAKMAYDLVQVNTEYQRLSASLKTLTGSTAAADLAFAGLKTFAAETPYQLTEVVGAFAKLKAMGLDPSNDSLRAYGNTASAMGKDLNQMIEAVADAATGEFERLKEFGIKAESEGDNVSFTFQGVTTTIKKNASEIEGYLQGIGQTNFAGAMAEQMNTLGGAFSNLQDAYANLLAEIGSNSGINTGLIDGMKELTETLQDPAFINGLTNIASVMVTMANATLKIGASAANGALRGAEIEKLNAQQIADGLRIKAKGFYTPWDEVKAELDASRQMYEYSRQQIDLRYLGDPNAAGNKLQLDTAVFPSVPTKGNNNKTTTAATGTASKINTADFMAERQPYIDEYFANQGSFSASSSIGSGFSLDGSTQEMGGGFSLSGELTPQDQFTLDSQSMLFDLKMSTLTEQYALEGGLAEEHQGWLSEIMSAGEQQRLDFSRATSAEKLGMITGDLLRMTQAVAGNNQAMFRINQAARVIDAGQEAVKGAVKTWNSYPYPWNIPMTALHVAGSAAYMSNLLGAGPQGGATRIGQGGGTDTSPIVTQPLSTPAQSSITVHIAGNLIGQDKWVEEELVPALRDLQSRNVTLQVT